MPEKAPLTLAPALCYGRSLLMELRVLSTKQLDNRNCSPSIPEVGGWHGSGASIRAQAAAEHEWGRAVTGPHTKKLEMVNVSVQQYIGQHIRERRISLESLEWEPGCCSMVFAWND